MTRQALECSEPVTSAKFQTAADVARFVLAGNAVFTISSTATGAYYTFKVQNVKDNPQTDSRSADSRYVNILGAGGDFIYFGMLNGTEFRLTKKSRMKDDSLSVRAFRFFCRKVLATTRPALPNGLEVRHEGRCGRCGRPLTVPSSIDLGIGPDCAEKMGLT